MVRADLWRLRILLDPTEPTLPLTMNPIIVLGDTPVPGNIPSVNIPEADSEPRVVLFQQLVLSIKKSNAMKK